METADDSLRALLVDLDCPSKTQFTPLFRRTYEALWLDDETAARLFDTSIANARRWREGKVVPPGAGIVLQFCRQLVEARVRARES